MSRVYLHGKLGGDDKWIGAKRYVGVLFDMIENTLNGFIDETNITAKSITAASLADLTVTGAKIASGTITSDKLADGIGLVASTSYVGDSTTANRTVALTFTPRYVKVVRTDATFIEYESILVGAAVTFWYRDAAGAQAASTANWQGIVTNGIKLGTNAAGTSNITGVTYAVIYLR